MREDHYRAWLQAQGRGEGTQNTSVSTIRRVELQYGDLDELFLSEAGLEGVRAELQYTRADANAGIPNPSRLTLEGDIYNGLAAIRTHLNYYERFCQEQEVVAARAGVDPIDVEENARIFSLERDLEAALRANIRQLEQGLTVVDEGRQRNVPSGRIDILAEDNDSLVVIELKAVMAPRDAVAQILAYMGDLASGGDDVRGILVAPEFDPRAVSAARMAPGLKLVKYSFAFTFEDDF